MTVLAERIAKAFDPRQPRDARGRWVDTGAGDSPLEEALGAFAKLGMADTLEGRLLREGERFEPRERTKEEDAYKGPYTECFRNATNAAQGLGEGYTYVEGFALDPLIPFPIHHAWVEDPNGKAVDVTWEKHGTEYIGIKLSNRELNRLLLKKEIWGVIDLYLQEQDEVASRRKT